jgi:hypothetical protein
MKANDVVTSRSNYRGGVGAERHMIGAFRFLCQRAEADGLVTANPAQKVQKPVGWSRRVTRCPMPGWPRSTPAPPQPETILRWTASWCASMSRRRVGKVARSH